MTGRRPGALYSPELLALAVELADFPFDAAAPLQGEARSRACGSTLLLSAQVDGKGVMTDVGLRLAACAVGQAAAAIFARAALGRELRDVSAAGEAVEQWLAGAGSQSAWPRLDALAPALAYTARHGAILLPWRAARDALCKASAGG